MKTFGELTIIPKSVSSDAFADRAEAAATNGWARDRSKDAQMSRQGGGVWYTFTLTGHQTLPPAFLFITQKRLQNFLYVPNIISPVRDHLSYDEYNRLLRSFYDDVLQRMEPKGEIDFTLTGTNLDLSKDLPKDVYERLRVFSATANKTTGSSHPYDRERWLDFLIKAVDAGTELDTHTLQRWLVEEERWGPEEAARLAEEYEFGRELLERRRRAS
jgi:hypothetical protein